MGMFDRDIIYGGEQLEPNVRPDAFYVLWECGIVATNVTTDLGSDGVKAELVISEVIDGDEYSEAVKFGTFASSIVDKVNRKSAGDLPAVVRFHKIPSKVEAHNDAFVMSFVSRFGGKPPKTMPDLAPFIDGADTRPAIDATATDTRELSAAAASKAAAPDGEDHPL